MTSRQLPVGVEAVAAKSDPQARSKNAKRLMGHLPAVAQSLRSLRASPRAASLLKAINARFGERHGMRSAEISLSVREISTSPTMSIAWLSLGLLALLYNASKYQINLAYGIAFLGATSILAGAWMGFLNLRGLKLTAEPSTNPVMSSDPVRFRIQIHETAGKRRKQLVLIAGEQEFEIVLDPYGTVEVEFLAFAEHPGRLLAPLIKLTTPYPLGIWNIHHLWAPQQECIVWPDPEIGGPSLKGLDERDQMAPSNQDRPNEGADGFSMLRAYRVGDSLRRVAWRVFAKTGGRTLATRLGDEPAGGAADLWIEELATLDLAGIPARVARLTAWVLQAHNNGLPYGLRAFGTEVEPSQGEAHLRACLTVLALAPGHQVEVAFGLKEWA